MKSLNELDKGRNNNFDLLRLFAATLVILSHSYLITGNFQSEPFIRLFGFIHLGAVGVGIFFTISGYLILKSLYRHKTIGQFVWARSLRIFPGLFIASLFCAFIIGPISTNLPLLEYFKKGETFEFIWRLSLLHNFKDMLPGVFINNPFPSRVNGPIWTLPAEILLYSEVVILGVVIVFFKKQFKLLLRLLPLIILLILFFFKKSYPYWYMQYIIKDWGLMFNCGMMFYWLRNKIKISLYILAGMLILLIVMIFLKFTFIIYVFYGTLIYGVFTFAYHPKLYLEKYKNWGDFSYGLYIYAFPIQQVLTSNLKILNPIIHFLMAFTITLPLAALSWYYIEKPMLSLKGFNFRKAEIPPVNTLEEK
jgi:peptidoglycan/LPS O-acetylase OafA/YrhL